MPDIKEEIISYLRDFQNITSYFGENYLRNSINHYFSRKKGSSYYHLANFIVINYGLENFSFFSELNEMLKYFHSEKHLQEYILNPKVKNKLKSMNMADFHSIWTECIFPYFLQKNNFRILKIGQRKGESTEKADIITDNGLFEVTAVLSEKDRYKTGEVFCGSNLISSDSKTIVNDKIDDKKNQNDATHIAIDCTFMDDLSEKLMSAAIFNFKTDFEVFKKIPKSVFIFTRHNVTEQVGPIRKI